MAHLLRRIYQLYYNSFTGLPRKVWLLALVLLVNRSGAMVVAFLSVYLINEQGYAPIKAGYVMAAFGAGGILGNYLGGLLNDRFGSWHIMLYSLIGAGVLHVLLGQMTSFWALCLMAFFISLVADAYRPASRAAVVIYAPPERLTQAYGLQRMAVNLGFSIGPALGGWLIYTHGFQLMFWGDGLTFLLAALVFYLALPKDETARPLVAREKRNQPQAPGLLDDHLVSSRQRAEGGRNFPANSQLAAPASLPAHRQGWLVVFVIANAAVIICFFQLFSTFPVFLKEFGVDERAIGWLFTLSGILIVTTEMPLLYIAERRYRPVAVMLVGVVLIVLSYLVLPHALTLGYVALVAMMMILTVGEILYMPFTNTYVSTYAPPARRGEYLGLLSASYSAAFVLCPLIGFWVADRYGYAVATFVCCGIAACGWLLLLRVEGLRKADKVRPSIRPQAS